MAPDILNAPMSVRKRLSHKKKETIMSRSVVVAVALLILPGFAHAQQTAVVQEGTHEVTRGETLWALAERYLGNPFRWPLIFEANRSSIQNPHLIFPGQVFVIPGLPGEPAAVREVAVMVEGDVRVPDPMAAPVRGLVSDVGLSPCPGPANRSVFFPGGEEERGCPLPSPSPWERTAFYRGSAAPAADRPIDQAAGELGFTTATAEAPSPFHSVPLGLVYAAEWLERSDREPEFVGILSSFAATEEDPPSRDRARRFERVQVTPHGGARFQVGDLLQAFEELRWQGGLGRVLRPTGILAVTEVEDDLVVAMVSAEFHWVQVGSRVRRAPSRLPPPGVHAEPVESNVTGIILGFPEDRPILGFGATAFLDVGVDQGIAVGDEFGAYPLADEHPPGTETARLRVVLVHGETSTARIVGLREPVLASGTPVRLVGKMW
jgi:hypothetical protein